MICLHCSDFSLHRAGEERARAGKGCCKHREAFISFAAREERDCHKFAQAAPAVIAKREKFLRGGK